ncbi:MAG: SoxR reducing system RseC family protein [Thermodesulfobacteriota bacterium]|nr:SoxR reducing system RseC family protein [Thermodesulfobacteriota bacterium]
MATEEGIVTAVTSTTAWVKTNRSSGCKHCSARHSCQPQDNQETVVEVENPVNARVGDRILLNVETAALLKASFLIYVFPILCMIAGAGLGQGAGVVAGLNPAWTSPVGAVIFFVGALFFMKSKGNRLAQSAAYRPEIVRILATATPSLTIGQT